MAVYQISDKPSGPWLELSPHDQPQNALNQGRAAFDWPVVWVAKMRRLNIDDLMTEEVWKGEVMERVTERFGSVAADVLEEEDILDQLWRQMSVGVWSEVLQEADVWVPAIKKGYGRDQNVRPVDFNPDYKPPAGKMSLKDLDDDS